LKRVGYKAENLQGLNRETASKLLNAVASNGWAKLTADEYAECQEQEANKERADIVSRGVFVPVVTDKSLNALFSDLPTREREEEEEELRPTLRQVVKDISQCADQLGRVLTAYKRLIGFRKWIPFLDLLGIHPRSAQRYMELSDLKTGLGQSAIEMLETQGVSLSTNSGNAKQEMAKKIAQKVIAKRNAYLDNPNTSSTTYLESQITDEQDRQFIAEAISEVRNPAENDEPLEDTPEARERAIRVLQAASKQDLTNLRSNYRDDALFKTSIASIFKEVMALEMNWALEAANV